MGRTQVKDKKLGEMGLKSYEHGYFNKANANLGGGNKTNVLYQNQKGIKRLCQRKQMLWRQAKKKKSHESEIYTKNDRRD